VDKEVAGYAIATTRLDLRLMDLGDARAVFDTYASDPEATKYMTFPTHADPSEASGFIASQQRLFGEGKTILWSIRLHDDPALVGAIELRLVGDEGEVGFIIGKKFWGHGFVPEALAAVIDVAQPGNFDAFTAIAISIMRSPRESSRRPALQGLEYPKSMSSILRWVRSRGTREDFS
jgi:RimJ/RimL family protein N-acetyltransferase